MLSSISRRLTLTSSVRISRLISIRMAEVQEKSRSKPYIGTHDGTFHCDDVTACFMLKQLDRFRDHDIVRTRNPEILKGAEVVVDVGAECDIERLRLDHHQRSFNQTMLDYHPGIKVTNPAKPVRLSSSGLVYAVFGKDIIANLLNLGKTRNNLDKEHGQMVDAIFEKAYLDIFEEIDAIDNGVEIVSGDNIVYNYHVCSSISSRVSYLNPLSNNPSPEERLVQFKKAMNLVGEEVVSRIDYLQSVWWPSRQLFRNAVLRRKEFDPSGRIVFLADGETNGWKAALYDIEQDLGIVGELLYIIFCNSSETTPWRVVAVPVGPKSFTSRMPLLEEWRGKRDEDLQRVSGIQDATFVHMSGFTGGATSLEGVRSLVHKTLAHG